MAGSLSRRVMETVLVFDCKTISGLKKIRKEGPRLVRFL
jgi:hypothetical protein